MKITWADLEVGMNIAGDPGWKVADLTATHITVADGEDGSLATFARKDPWESVEIETLSTETIVESFGGHIIREDVEGQPVTFYAWPNDNAFLNAAQSHLTREHHVDPSDKTYDELRALHEELHESPCDHEHIR